MTRREKESLLCSFYESAYHYWLECAREKNGFYSKDEEAFPTWKAFARNGMASVDAAIMRIYKDTGRDNSLDQGDMYAAINKLRSIGESDGRAVNPSQRTRADIIRIIREMDIDDDETDGDDA